MPETGGEEKGEEELEKEEQERCWESKGREEGRSWEMGRAGGRRRQEEQNPELEAWREKRIPRKCVLRGEEDVLGDGEELREAG